MTDTAPLTRVIERAEAFFRRSAETTRWVGVFRGTSAVRVLWEPDPLVGPPFCVEPAIRAVLDKGVRGFPPQSIVSQFPVCLSVLRLGADVLMLAVARSAAYVGVQTTMLTDVAAELAPGPGVRGPYGEPAALKLEREPCKPPVAPRPAPHHPIIEEISIPGEGDLTALMKTSFGPLLVRLDEARAPRMVANFVALALGKQAWWDSLRGEWRHGVSLYEGTRFHRVIGEYLMQGGDPTGTGEGGPGYDVADEIHPELRFEAGAVAMASRGPDTNGSQFFILADSAPWLEGKYSIFGKVLDVERVASAARAVRPRENDRPQTDIILESIDIFRGGRPQHPGP